MSGEGDNSLPLQAVRDCVASCLAFCIACKKGSDRSPASGMPVATAGIVRELVCVTIHDKRTIPPRRVPSELGHIRCSVPALPQHRH